ncbi:MAG: hypothetical protein IT422_24375, partial [Pirellulaceae bacterium]|nr:hypothetical protein [Pirellulaceae bacterium]
MLGFRKRLVATLVWIAHRCRLWNATVWRSTAATVEPTEPSVAQPRAAQTNCSKLSPPPISFRRLEPRRVLSVNAAFAAGVLDIVIQDDGGTTDASLLSDDGVHFFVDADGDQSYDDGSTGASELRGLLSELIQVHVVGDAGVGNFTWRNNFSTSPLGAPSGNAVDISQVENIELATDAEVAGNVSLSATQTIHLNGALSLHGDLSAQTTSPTGQITNDTAGSLDVVGHADLNAHTIDLGNQVGDHLSLNSLTITSDGSVNISEDGSATDVATQLTGTNTAHSLHLSNNGSITLVSGATFDVDGNLQLKADGVDANIAVDGSITSNDGNVDLLAGDQVTLGSAASISVGGNGALSIEVQGSGIDMADGSQLVVDQGSVLLSATGSPGAEIHLSQMHTGSGSTANFTVEATGDILDNTASEDANILAPTGTLVLRSLNGSIGADPGNAAGDIDIDVQDLQFEAGAALGTVHVTDLAGGLRIHAPSHSGASAIISAHSPLVIAADVTVGGSSTFTAGNSPLTGDNLTIDNGATVTLNSLAPATLTFNAGDDILFLNDGRIVTTGSNSHEVILNADLDHTGVGAADGDRGSITHNSAATVEVTTNRLTAVAAGQIDLDTLVDNLDARSTDMGNIRIGEGNAIQLDHVETANGAIDIVAAGTVVATHVDSSATDSDANGISIVTTSGDIIATWVRGGALQGDVLLDAQGSIIDGDSLVDDVDVEGNDVTLIARGGNIGLPAGNFFKDRPDGLDVITQADPLLPLQPGNLTVSAVGGSIALQATVAGAIVATSDTLFVLSDGDLDVSTSTFTVANLGLIADADGNSAGTVTLGGNLTVTGDLRLEGADIIANGPSAPQLDIAATRVLLRSGGQADLLVATQFLDATARADLTITSTATSIELVDLNCDNIALQTLNGNASIMLHSSGNVVVADDIWAGNDGATNSTANIHFDFVSATTGDILIHDTLLTDAGSISLTAAGSIRLEAPAVADPQDETGADNLPVITSISGNIALQAQGVGSNGQIFMADGTQIIAGRAALVDYQAGINGLPSPSTIVLGSTAQAAGQAEISLSASDNITIASLQSAGTSHGSVQVTSAAGAIIDGGNSDVDVIAHQPGAGAKLTSFTGIGSTNAIDLDTPVIEARNLGTSGNVGLHQVTAGGDLQTLAAINTADGGSVLVAVDAGSLEIAGAGSAAVNGDITLLASNDIHVLSAVKTTATGDVLLRADNATGDATLTKVDGITIDASVSSETGSVLLQSLQDIRIASTIVSAASSVGLIASRDITQTANVTAGGDVLINAVGNFTQSSGTSTMAGLMPQVPIRDTLQVITGGTQRLALLSAGHISLDAGGDILDNNGIDVVNLRANTLRMVAGGIIGGPGTPPPTPLNADINANAIDTEVGIVAARSAQGIYLQEVASGGDLTIGHVEGSASLSVRQVALDGTTSSVPVGDGNARPLDDLETSAGPIKVVVRGGNLTINDGTDGDGIGVVATGASDILLWASSNLDINAQVRSGGGHVTLQAGNDIDIDAAVSTV